MFYSHSKAYYVVGQYVPGTPRVLSSQQVSEMKEDEVFVRILS